MCLQPQWPPPTEVQRRENVRKRKSKYPTFRASSAVTAAQYGPKAKWKRAQHFILHWDVESSLRVVYSEAMSAITFDTHAYVKKLKAVGVSEEQAEVQAGAISELVNNRLVTKEDLEHALKELEYRLIIRLGSMMVVAIGIVTALVKLL